MTQFRKFRDNDPPVGHLRRRSTDPRPKAKISARMAIAHACYHADRKLGKTRYRAAVDTLRLVWAL